MEKEIWKDIEGYEGLYQVSNLGRVKSLKFGKEKILKPCIAGKGYLQVMLVKNGTRKHYYVHRLVGVAFIPNPDNLPEVNHISEDKLDCAATNLEWISHIDNVRHGTAISRGRATRIANGFYAKQMKKVVCVELKKIFNSITEAAKELSCAECTINNCLRGREKTAKGYHWRYVEE